MDPNEVAQSDQQPPEIVYEDKPIKMICRYCNSDIVTTLSMVPSMLSFLVITLVVILVGMLPAGMIMVPLILFTAHKSHRCPVCSNVLGKSTDIFNFWIKIKDEIIPISFGTELAIVASRRLLVNIFLVVLIMGFGFWRISITDLSAGVPIDTTWPQFLEECGAKNFDSGTIYSNNTIKQRWRKCESTFIGRTFINWTGHVIRVEDNRLKGTSFFKAISILVKMSPPEFEDKSDIVLNINYKKAHLFESKIVEMDHGSEIVFNATLRSLMLTRANFMHVTNFTLTGESTKLPEDLHHNSRFDFRKPKNKKFLGGLTDKLKQELKEKEEITKEDIVSDN